MIWQMASGPGLGRAIVFKAHSHSLTQPRSLSSTSSSHPSSPISSSALSDWELPAHRQCRCEIQLSHSSNLKQWNSAEIRGLMLSAVAGCMLVPRSPDP
jgi:hypothetical protein